MSTIDVANLTDAESTTTNSANSSDALNNTTTVDTKYITNGSAKVWSVYTDATFLSSMNVSSITSNGTGSNEVNITNDMLSRNYQVDALTYNSSGNTIVMYFDDFTDSCTFRARNWNGSTFVAVNSKTAIGIMGDLA